MNATGCAVQARGLVKRYGGIAAVSGIDLEIAPGEVFALLGPNGAGKTTTVEILEGYRDRDGGEVSVLGTDPQRAGRAWRARIGIVLQLAADAPELTVAEMVGNFAGFYPSPRRPAEVIDLVGLADKARARIHTLSGGQQRRLDVALGLIGGPELLLGAIFGKQGAGHGVTIGDLYVAGLIGAGVMATSYQNLGMSIAFERERFTVKTHLLRACTKLGVSGRTAAVTKAIETGALPAPGQPT
jgi:predicted ABC-type transport system involved in lysophospholipase L1 biosynthesis ATPase subunit